MLTTYLHIIYILSSVFASPPRTENIRHKDLTAEVAFERLMHELRGHDILSDLDKIEDIIGTLSIYI
jgi:hypothetical protein